MERAEPTLERLTPEQREAVTRLMAAAYMAGTLDGAQEVTIEGAFNGWDGETIVKLTDGTVLEQNEYEYSYCYAYRPDARLTCQLGGCELQVHDRGCSENIKVTVLDEGRNPGLGRLRQFRQAVRRIGIEQLFDIFNRLFTE